MKSLVALFLISIGLSSLLVPATRWAFLRLGKLDHPDPRRMHAVAVPRSGGLAVFGSYLLAVGFMAFLPAGGNYVFERYESFLMRLIPAIGIVFITGFMDDWLDLKPAYKLTGQFMASAFAYWAGIRLFDAPPGWEWLAFAATCLWLILCSNAINLTDGTDGLAGTLGVVSCLGLITVALTLDYYSLALVFTPLLGAILPFLRANWPPATLFLGDTGSLTMGFLIGCGGAALARRFPNGEGIVAASLILTLPLMEVALSSLRRALRGQPIMSADSFHIHHQLKRQGLGSARVLLHLGVMSLVGTTIAVIQIWCTPWQRVFLIVPFLVLLSHGIAALRYPEFNVLWDAILGGRIRRWLRHQILLRTMEDEVAGAHDLEALLKILQNYALALGLLDLNVNLAGAKNRPDRLEPGKGTTYLVRIDLPLDSWVNFRVPVGLKRTENPAADFASLVLRLINLQRLGRLRPEADAASRPNSKALALDRSS